MNVLSPGMIDIPMIVNADPAAPNASVRMIPAGPTGAAAEVAETAMVLASDASSCITRVAFPVERADTPA